MSAVLQAVQRGMDHHRHGRLAQAELEYRSVLSRNPENPDALHLLGVITAGRGKQLEGIALIERSLSVFPSSPEAHFNLANIYAALYRFDDAERHFREAFRLRPTHAEAANGVGGAALRMGRYVEAEKWLSKAISLDANCISALINTGILMDATNRYSKTIEYYDRALALDPQQPEARQFRALALLARGQFGEGWREYVWRFRYSASFSGRFPIPHWRGEPLAGQKILVWTEQGLGDEVLIASMIPDLLCRGARIVLVASARLCELFARSFPTVDIIPAEELHAAEAIADVAYQASMSDLGQHLRPSFDAFPSTRSYLAADAGLARSLRETYQSKNEGNLLVGISWRSQARDGGAQKTVALRQWEPLLISPGFTFVNLQYGDTTAEVAETERVLGIRILTDPTVGALGSLDPFASQVAALDHVITVSNTTAHMAGALGKETSVLIPSNAGRLWYWFLERADSPWYPSLRLFRQRGADWKGVMRQVAEVLISRRSSQELKG